ncbi:MAG TPA: TadE/TadG family type IV pilus assembly protein [Sphingomicrobium sp.]|nr:TadE/TadG family type IV pilus assembly protein [Sphingomicrobium sp.]
MRRLIRDRGGASAAEFALVLPLLILLLFGIIDGGRYMWAINRAEKAAQMGVRMAVVTDFAASSIDSNYVGACSPALTGGDPIPAGCFTSITCSRSGTTVSCPGGGTADPAAFNTVYNRIRLFMPEIQPNNVQIIYSDSGLGYAGNPNGPDLAPLVTVRLFGMTFRPIVFLALWNVALPEVRSSLTFEDGQGSASN